MLKLWYKYYSYVLASGKYVGNVKQKENKGAPGTRQQTCAALCAYAGMSFQAVSRGDASTGLDGELV